MAPNLPQKAIRSGNDLVRAGLIDPNTAQELADILHEFSVGITPSVASIILSADPEGGVAQQFIPTADERVVAPDELEDPIGDNAHSPVKGIVHRYPDRVLLKPLHACAVFCRFCFRREQVGAGGETLSDAELSAALDYVQNHNEIWEVILSGGDPLILSPRRLSKLRSRLEAIKHVRVIRVHTRIPTVDPQRITESLISALRRAKPTYIVIHSNHPDEFTSSARSACARLADAGFPLLSQSVLLRGINDNLDTLTRLLRTFVENRIKPYYLHHGDLARGTGHFRTTIAEGQSLVSSLRGSVSGLCQPTYILDIPGGHGKVPIGPSYLAELADGSLRICDPHDRWHGYSDQFTASRL